MQPGSNFFLKLINKFKYFNIVDSASSLIYIHIGKCGGTSLGNAIERSDVLSQKFSSTSFIHVEKPPILNKAKYLIVVRNPIERTISAFNWRYKLVVDEEVQRYRHRGEWGVLKNYGNINNISEKLYVNGEPNLKVHRDLSKIFHIKQDINFYLGDLLSNVNADQIFCVLAMETLSSDVERFLNIKTLERAHENATFVKDERKYLSDLGAKNLRLYLQKDYDCLERLFDLVNYPDEKRDKVLGVNF